MVTGEVEEKLGEEVEDRIWRQGTEVADDAGGGEPVFGGEHGVEVRQPARSGVVIEARKTVIAVTSGWLTFVGGIEPGPSLTRTAARGQERQECSP